MHFLEIRKIKRFFFFFPRVVSIILISYLTGNEINTTKQFVTDVAELKDDEINH